MTAPLVHWVGGIRNRRAVLFLGTPACCAGPRAAAISADPAACATEARLVTCPACLRWLALERAAAAPPVTSPRPAADVRHEVVADHIASRLPGLGFGGTRKKRSR